MRWRKQLDAAWVILAERRQHRVATITAAIQCLIPMERTGVHGAVSASSGDAPGAVALSEPAGSAVDGLPEAGLTEDVRRVADDLVRHHRMLWQLRNVEPETAEVETVAEQLRRREPIPTQLSPVQTTVPAVASGDSPLFRLAAAWLEAPEAVRGLPERPELVRAALSRLAPIAGNGWNPLAELASHYVAGTSTSDSMRR